MDDIVGTVATAIGYLTVAGYRISFASNGEQTRAAVSEGDVDLAILDVDLLPLEEIEKRKIEQQQRGEVVFVAEERAGNEVAKWIRDHHPHVGIVMYTSQKTDVASQLDGKIYADEYIVKGDSYKDFVEKIQSTLRRRRFVQGAFVMFNEYELNLAGKTVRRPDGDITPLTDAEFRLLEALVMSPRKVMSRRSLYQEAFRVDIPDASESSADRSIDNLVLKLRKKLALLGAEYTDISTVYGAGYRLDAEVSYKW